MDSPEEILLSNDVTIVRIGKDMYLEHNGKQISRPDKPSACYEVLLNEFNITEPRLLEFKKLSLWTQKTQSKKD